VNSSPRTTPSSTTLVPRLAQVLQEDHDLEALAVHRREAEQPEAEQQPAGAEPVLGRQQRAAAAVVMGDPTGPVDLVEEPVHHDEQDDDRRDPGRRLHVEPAVPEQPDEPDGDEPRAHRREQRDHAADSDRAAVDAVAAEEARGDRGQHEDRLEPLAEHEHRAVDHRGRAAHVRARRARVGRAAGCVPAEHDADHGDGEDDGHPEFHGSGPLHRVR
jgi:hypothetical protein